MKTEKIIFRGFTKSRFYLGLEPITIGTFVELLEHSIRTASFGDGSAVVVIKVVDVTVGDVSSQSYESHGHPLGQLFLILV